MIDLEYEKEGNTLKNVRVTKDGKQIGTLLSCVKERFSWYYITLECDGELELVIVGDFVLVVGKDAPWGPHSTRDGHISLALIESEPEEFNVCPIPTPFFIWETITLLCDNQKNPISTLREYACSFVSFEGAIYIPENPYRSMGYDDFVDKTSYGRWLFPHPDGAKASFDHMKKTTLQDDYHRLLPHLDGHPELLETFSEL